MNKKIVIREQLNSTLVQFKPLLEVAPPLKGWIRAIRDALGMSARQLADRMGIAQQAVARIEKDEKPGAVTLKTMPRAAEQLDCVFVYGFVPKSSLEETVSKQAAIVKLIKILVFHGIRFQVNSEIYIMMYLHGLNLKLSQPMKEILLHC